MALYELTKSGVRNTITIAYIPDSSRNHDWLTYQDWLALGNTPDPQPPVIKPTIDQEYDAQSDWIKAIVFKTGLNLVDLKAQVTSTRP